MSDSFIEIIYIDSDDDARQTNLRYAGRSNAATWQIFNGLRRYGVDFEVACFLLDYHNAKGDLSDTIAIDGDGFRAITHLEPLSDADYRRIDADFWADVSKECAA